MIEAPALWLALLAAAVVTYAWRGLGVVMAGRIDPAGPLFRWVGCVAYALLAGLVARMILLPIGPLAETPMATRILATCAGLLVFLVLRRNLLAGLAAGLGMLLALEALAAG